MRTICIIPARGGSTRIKDKNIRPFHGKPIIAYSIQAALSSQIFDAVYVSTDSVKITETAREWGAIPLPRNPDDGHKGMIEVIGDVLRKYEHLQPIARADFVCCLFATAPMLRASTLQASLTDMRWGDCDYLVPVGTWLQDPGQFYWGTKEAFLANTPLIQRSTGMHPIDPATECDINTEFDWRTAEQMYAELYP